MTKNNEEQCAVIHALDILGRKWIPWILCELIVHEELYFTNLLNNVIGSSGGNRSARVLSEALSRLEEEEMDIGVVLSTLKGWTIKWSDISHKKCKSFTCVHNAVPMIDIDKAKKLQGK